MIPVKNLPQEGSLIHRYHLLLRSQLQKAMHDYRTDHELTQEDMAALLHVAPRSYVDQEHGKYGFSAATLVFFLTALPEDRVIPLLDNLRDQMERDNSLQ